MTDQPEAMSVAELWVADRDLKMLRESLCAAQTSLPMQFGTDRTRLDVERLGLLIGEIDRHRPLGPDGSHGDRHTATCGCEDK